MSSIRTYIILALLACVPCVGIAQKYLSPANQDSLRERLKYTVGREQIQTCIMLSTSFAANDPDSFLHYAKMTLKLAESKPELAALESEAHYHLGEAYSTKDDYHNALKHFMKAVENVEEEHKGRMEYLAVINQIGLLHYNMGEYDKAIAAYHDILEHTDSTHYNVLSTMYNNIGGVFFKQKKFDKAIDYFEKSMHFRERMNVPQEDFAAAYNNLGTCYKEVGRYPEALEYLLKAIQLQQKTGSLPGLANSYQNIASVYHKMNRKQLAMEYLDKAEAAADSSKIMSLQIGVYRAISKTNEKFGNFQRALEYAEKAQVLKDSLKLDENRQAIAALESQYEVERQAVELDALKKQQLLSQEVERRQKRANMFLIGGLALTLLLGVFVLAGFIRKKKDNRLITEQKELVESQKIIVETQKEEILDSIKYARQLQDNTLPSLAPLKQHFEEHFVLYLPKDIVSGDFYWVGEPQNSTYPWVLFGVGDCTGHGVPGALLTMMAQNYFQTSLRDKSVTNIGEILGFIDQWFKRLISKEGSSGHNHGMDAALCAYNLENGELHFAGARNPLVVVREGEMQIYKGDKRGIGETHHEGMFTDQVIPISKGDTIYMFSDGFVDQFGGVKGKKLKLKAFRELILDNHKRPMQEQWETYLNFYNEWKGTLEQIDDVCVLGVRI